jgi:ACR3 family arsenite efflux pump ArsB
VRGLLGADIEVDVAGVMGQIGLIVFLPMAVGYATQRFLVRRFGQKAFAERIGPRFPALSTIGVLGIVMIAIALKARKSASSPQLLAEILVPWGSFTQSTTSSRPGRPVVFSRARPSPWSTARSCATCPLPAVAINAFGAHGSEAALVVALAYIIQVQSAAWYVKLTDRLFGPVAIAAVPAPQPARGGSS